MVNGKFYVFEGVDGAGKTVISRAISRRLKANWTCEPFKKFLLSEDSRENLYRFGLDRHIHNRDVINPLLNAGNTVVCDRYWLSTLCYQSNDQISTTLAIPGNCPVVDAWFVLHPDIDVAISRRVHSETPELLDRLLDIDTNYRMIPNELNINNCYHIDVKQKGIIEVVNNVMDIIIDSDKSQQTG